MQAGKNDKYTLILISLLFPLMSVISQNVSFTYIDSLSYQQFMAGNWNALIETAKLAEKNDISFKWLSQRAGYACFMKKEYYQSMKYYEDALMFDFSDEISHLYLYYNGLNTGEISYARAHADKLSGETQQAIKYQTLRPVDAVDMEFNYKTPVNNELRDKGYYYRTGINSYIGNHVNLYQSVSYFHQLTDYTTLNTQQEYYGIVSWNPDPNWCFSAGYHYTGIKVVLDPDTTDYPGHLFYGRINRKINRFDLSMTVADYHNAWIHSFQTGIHLGCGFSGTFPSYLKSSLYLVNESGLNYNAESYNYNRLIFKQSAGISVLRYLWLEAYTTVGDLNYFADNNGLYLYNTLDPTVFKTGGTIFGYIGKHLTIYLNYNFDQKYVYMYQQYYQQHGLTGGMIWKF